MESKAMNRSLSAAKAAKQDEFYTQYVDIQKEVEAYLEYDPDTFRNKVVYCNCDDPFESNVFKYFAAVGGGRQAAQGRDLRDAGGHLDEDRRRLEAQVRRWGA